MRISDWSSDVCSSDLVAFLVAGDQQRDRPMRTPASQVLADGGDEGGNGALHVDGTAAVKRAVTDLAGEGVDAPGGGIADRHHVGMTGARTAEHTSEIKSLMRTSYAFFCLKKNTKANSKRAS